MLTPLTCRIEIKGCRALGATSLRNDRPVPQACAMTDLYIMARSDAPGIVKIGSSQNVERRRQQLEAGHTFRMVTLASFPGAGVFEQLVHRKLDNARVLTGTGREWYRMSPSEAFQAAADAVFAPAPNPKTVAHPSPCLLYTSPSPRD